MGNIYVRYKPDIQYGYRKGQWAQVVDIVWFNKRIVLKVEFIDGKTDTWPVFTEPDKFEFAKRDLHPVMTYEEVTA